jgi:hypothetical protein
MRQIVVGLWSRPVKSKHKSVGATLFQLGQAMAKTKEAADALGLRPADGRLRTIFIAPEFLFTSRREEDDHSGSTGLERYQRNAILTQLDQLAEAHPSMLLVPGTIVFKEPLNEKTATKALVNLRNALAPKTKSEPRTRPIPIHKTQEYTDKYNDLSISEGSKKVYEEQIAELTLHEKNTVIRQPGVMDRFLIKNRTYVYFDKKKLFSYGKKCNMNDFAEDAEKGIYVPGKKEGIIQVDRAKVGFEICFDHSIGILKDHMNGPSLDLHVICSAEVPNNHANFAVKANGYVLHASSSPDFTTVFKKTETPGKMFKGKPIMTSSFDRVDMLAQHDIDSGPLRLYQIELPD